MNLSKRIDLMVQLGTYISQNDESWQAAKQKAYIHNGWFLPEFIDLSTQNIVQYFLQEDALKSWLSKYPGIKDENHTPKQVGIVMAGNLPLVGFHDFLCVFMSGNKCLIKPSSKDETLIKHLVEKLIEWEPALKNFIAFSDLLKNCDAYIATGSNNTANYFEYYFGKYPHIIRKNKTSVALLTGEETNEELELLANDVYQYFGMGCRNITKVYVPQDYDFVPLLTIFKKYDYLADHHKYKNNLDYNLALHILNNRKYMSTAALILVDDENMFSPVSQLNYEYYKDQESVLKTLQNSDAVQCVVGNDFINYGAAQRPTLLDYADGVDTVAWLSDLSK